MCDVLVIECQTLDREVRVLVIECQTLDREVRVQSPQVPHCVFGQVYSLENLRKKGSTKEALVLF